MNRARDLLVRIPDAIGGFFLGLLVAVIALQVFCRYVLSRPLPWPEELAGYLFVWLTYMGLVKVVRENSHYRIDFLMRMLPPRIQTISEIGFNLVIILSLLVALWGVPNLFRANWQILSPAMEVSLSVLYLALPLAILFIVPHLCVLIYRGARALGAMKPERRGPGERIGGGSSR